MYDIEQMSLEYAKSFMDKSRIYFIEKYFSTFNASVGKYTPFELFPRQKVFLKNIAEHSKNISLKHRQCGITTISSAWSAAQCVFASKEAPEVILCIANKLEQAQELLFKIRDFLMQVPRWFWGDDFFSPDPKSEKNKKDIFVTNSKSKIELCNGCKVFARSSGANAARGISAVSILIFDEAAFIEDGQSVYTSAVAATASNPNRKIIMVSTPNGQDELYYNTYKQAVAKENGYIVTEFKWYQDLRYNKHLKWYKKDEKTGELEWIIEPTLDATGTVKYDEELWKQRAQDGWSPTSEWYMSMCQSFNNDSMKIAQELDVSFMGSANNVVDPQFIEMHRTLNVREPLEEMKDPLVEETWFWKPPIDGHRYLICCLPEGEKVLTQDGEKCVESVSMDDLLVTKDGEYTKIAKKMSRNYEGDIFSIKLYGDCNMYSFTSNHPIYASINTPLKRYNKGPRYWDFNFDYHNANLIKKGDWLKIPNLYYDNDLTEEEIISHWEKYKTSGKGNKHMDCPLLSELFWWYCGMWLAEGHLIQNKGNITIVTTHHIDEEEYYEKIKLLGESVINRKIGSTKDTKFNTLICRFTCKSIGNFLKDNFGLYSYGKHIAEWIKFLPKKYKTALLQGYFEGDGCITNQNLEIVSVSHRLLMDVQDLFFSLGIISSIKKKNDQGKSIICGRICNIRDKYSLICGKFDTLSFSNLINYESNIKIKNRRIISYSFFSDDKKYIYIRVSNVVKQKYNGLVYNFETVSDSHSFCTKRIATHNCDPSRGVSEDRTAIEVIDLDGQDENGLPIVEQVMEYLGKKLGDDIGGLLYQYGTMYNNAYIIVDCTGGSGDAAILTLINMGYKNLYYEDSSQKTYTMQYSTKLYDNYSNKLPGFHFQGNRYPVLSNFAGMVRNNEFKIRSIRVINELETWIFKGDTGRMDHQSGSHDDTLTALAMGLFIMQFSFNKLEASKNKDAAILGAYMVGGGTQTHKPKTINSMQPTTSAPMYSSKQVYKTPNVQGGYMWLFSTNKYKK